VSNAAPLDVHASEWRGAACCRPNGHVGSAPNCGSSLPSYDGQQHLTKSHPTTAWTWFGRKRPMDRQTELSIIRAAYAKQILAAARVNNARLSAAFSTIRMVIPASVSLRPRLLNRFDPTPLAPVESMA
jgi:hypothetical protein